MTDGTPQKPAADWYPDPSGTGQMRYWDGEQWTQELRAVEQAAAAVVAPAVPEVAAAANPEQGTPQAGDTAVLGTTGGYSAGFVGVQGSVGAQVGSGQQFVGQQQPRLQHAHSNEAGFFRSLFDLSFAAERSVTTSFAKVLYVISIAVAVISWIGIALLFFVIASLSYDGTLLMMSGVFLLIFGWIPAVIQVVCSRVVLELATAVIRTSQHTAELVRLGRAAAQ